MNKTLKHGLIISVGVLMMIGVGSFGGTFSANAKVHRTQTVRIRRTSHKSRAQKYHRIRAKRSKRRNRRTKSYYSKPRRKRKSFRKGRSSRIFKSRFKRSNNPKRLRKSGFLNGMTLSKQLGFGAAKGDFIFNKYAPNDRRAVIPKHLGVTHWFQGRFGQSHPKAYKYNAKQKGWIFINK